MKKLLTFALTLVCVLGLAGCSETADERIYEDLSETELSYTQEQLEGESGCLGPQVVF